MNRVWVLLEEGWYSCSPLFQGCDQFFFIFYFLSFLTCSFLLQIKLLVHVISIWIKGFFLLKEHVVLCWWWSETLECGIKRVDEGQIDNVNEGLVLETSVSLSLHGGNLSPINLFLFKSFCRNTCFEIERWGGVTFWTLCKREKHDRKLHRLYSDIVWCFSCLTYWMQLKKFNSWPSVSTLLSSIFSMCDVSLRVKRRAEFSI